jgi:hypothetical protein
VHEGGRAVVVPLWRIAPQFPGFPLSVPLLGYCLCGWDVWFSLGADWLAWCVGIACLWSVSTLTFGFYGIVLSAGALGLLSFASGLWLGVWVSWPCAPLVSSPKRKSEKPVGVDYKPLAR